jgi:GNAT superfamily N-acetyltransferase
MSNDTSQKDYTIERLTQDRLKDLERLYNVVYGRSVPKKYFKIKYDSRYTGHEYVGFIAYSEQHSPIAYYGVLPCFLQCGGQKILAAQSADTMTHPEYRYKGLFVELSQFTFDLCRQLGIRIIYGFPNQNSYPAMVHKLGWKMIHSMELFILPVRSFPVAKLLRGTWLAGKLYDSYASRTLGKYRTTKKTIPNSVLKDKFCGQRRDKDYEGAKNYHAREVLDIDGSLVWCRINVDWIIGDMDTSAGDFDGVMKKILELARKLGIRQVQFQASPGTSLHSLFAAKYESIPSFPALIQPFDPNINIAIMKFTFADIDVF